MDHIQSVKDKHGRASGGRDVRASIKSECQEPLYARWRKRATTRVDASLILLRLIDQGPRLLESLVHHRHFDHGSAIMSTPQSQRSQRSQRNTPSRRSQDATPRQSRPAPPQSSSPLFYQSSPAARGGLANGTGQESGPNGIHDISSPLRQMSVADSTPRGRPAVGGDSETDAVKPLW